MVGGVLGWVWKHWSIPSDWRFWQAVGWGIMCFVVSFFTEVRRRIPEAAAPAKIKGTREEEAEGPDGVLCRAPSPGEPELTDAALSRAHSEEEEPERLAASTDNSTEAGASARR